jgi:hypothetical protein
MNGATVLKAAGYLISTASVILLGVVAWNGAKGDPSLRLCLTAGMTMSVAGMALRFLSHWRDQREGHRE